jgi:lysophospholipase L1-like esterase
MRTGVQARRRVSSRRKWLWCAASLLLGLALAEIVARAIAPAQLPRPRYSGEVLRASEQPGRGRELIPGSVLQITLSEPAGERVVVHRVGPHGWRGAPFEARKPRGVRRIACVGDSNVFGWGVGDDDTWPARLGVELARLGARDVEVLNLGVPNLDAEEKVALSDEVAFALECDLVLLGLHFDDWRLEGAPDGALGGNARALASTRPGRRPWLDLLRANLRCVDLVVERWRRRLLARAYLAPKLKAAREGSATRARVEAAFAGLAGRAQARGVALFAVVIPMPVRDGGGWASAELDAALETAVRAAGLRALDVATELAAERREVAVHPLDMHLNEAGHRAVARALATELAPWLERLEHGVDEGRDDRHGLQEDEHDRRRKQDEEHRHQPPEGTAPHGSDQLDGGGDADSDAEEELAHETDPTCRRVAKRWPPLQFP